MPASISTDHLPLHILEFRKNTRHASGEKLPYLTVTVTQSGLGLDLGSGNLHKLAPHPTLLATHGAVGCHTRLLVMVAHLLRQLSFLLTASMAHTSSGSGRGGGSGRGQGGGRLKVFFFLLLAAQSSVVATLKEHVHVRSLDSA